MGDRANVYVRESAEAGVFLYTHGRGTELPETVQAGLRRAAEADRLQDTAYLTRILFCEMVKGDVLGATGYGISTRVEDGDRRIIVVNPSAGTVGYAMNGTDPSQAPLVGECSIADFLGAHECAWP